jgi:hypothetical protein
MIRPVLRGILTLLTALQPKMLWTPGLSASLRPRAQESGKIRAFVRNKREKPASSLMSPILSHEGNDMNARFVVVGIVVAGLSCVMLGLRPSQASAMEGCAKCHGKAAPVRGDRPTAAKLDSLSSFSEWEESEIEGIGKTHTSVYSYVTACMTHSRQHLITYPDDPDRQKFMYLYSPRTKNFWARCEIDRPAGAAAEWSFRIDGKWSERKQSNLLVPGTKRKLAEPPIAPL